MIGFERFSRKGYVIGGYILGMILSLESFIWGRELVLSVAGGLLA